jgi:uncharacterized protein YaaN involved in tellurite resistance
MSDHLEAAIEEIHARSAEGPVTEVPGSGSTFTSSVRKVVVGLTHHTREHQQHVDHAIIDAIVVEHDERRQDTRVLEATTEELRAMVTDLERRVAVAAALDRDLSASVHDLARRVESLERQLAHPVDPAGGDGA